MNIPELIKISCFGKEVFYWDKGTKQTIKWWWFKWYYTIAFTRTTLDVNQWLKFIGYCKLDVVLGKSFTPSINWTFCVLNNCQKTGKCWSIRRGVTKCFMNEPFESLKAHFCEGPWKQFALLGIVIAHNTNNNTVLAWHRLKTLCYHPLYGLLCSIFVLLFLFNCEKNALFFCNTMSYSIIIIKNLLFYFSFLADVYV